ncbi:tail fiber domain-containing protein [Lachnospiraceae bacterium 54-53]
MLNIPEEIKALYRKDRIREETVKEMSLRFYDNFPGSDDTPVLIIGPDQIYYESFALSQMICDSTSLTFGQCCAAKVEIIAADVIMDVTGKWFTLSIEVGGYEIIMGIYKVNSFERQADRRFRKIVAYDQMLSFDIDASVWYRGLTFPMNLKQFRTSLCDYVGVRQQDTTLPLDDMEVTRSIDPSELSGRDVMKSICEINGCFGQIDNAGKFKYVFLGPSGLYPSEELFPSDDLYPSEMQGENLSHLRNATYEDFFVKGIDKVQIRQEEGDVGASYGQGTNAYTIQGNFLVYGKGAQELLNIAATVYENISRKVYRPCKIVTQALPWVEPGDGIICYTSDDAIETYCLKRTIKGIQAMMDTFEAQGTRERKENFGIGTQIIQLEGKTAIIKKSVEEVSVRVTDLKAETETKFTQTAEQILAEVTRAQQAEASLNIRADQIATSVTNLANNTNSRFEQTAEQISMKVSVGAVTGNLNSELKITGNKIDLTTGHFTVAAKNLTVDEAGNANFSGTVEGARFIGGSINIGNGTFWVDSGGNAAINAGQINLGAVSINPNYSDLGAFRVSNAEYGGLFSANGEVELSTSAWYNGGPALELKRSGMTTRVGHGAISTGDIDLTALSNEYGSQWSSVARNIIGLWNEITYLKNR